MCWQMARCTSKHKTPPLSVLQVQTWRHGPSHSFSEYLRKAWISIWCILGSVIPWEGLRSERSGNTCLSGSWEYHIAQCHHWVISGHVPENFNVENLDACRDETFSANQCGSGTFRFNLPPNRQALASLLHPYMDPVGQTEDCRE